MNIHSNKNQMEASSRQRCSQQRQDRSIAGLYDMERSLGSGHFAVVKLARHVFTGLKVAIKVIDKTKLDDVAKAHLYQEVRCMKLVQHPNVVRLFEVIDTQSKLYLILEYGDGGDMYDHIMKYEGEGISEEKARHYFKQIVSAIDYCHKLHVVHRDLKPENVIFFKNNDLAKLTDFGFSNSFLPGEKLHTSCGSLAYSAPEILLGDSYDAPAVDVWSLGVILYMMVCGRGPFNHASDPDTVTKIMDCHYDLPDDLSAGCKSLIQRMLVRQASGRASIDSIIQDEWVNQGTSITVPHTPLISEISITKDVHMSVLQKMSRSWTKEDIEKSLQNDQYDHLTATYFLLAESSMKKRHGPSIPFHVKLDERHSVPSEFMLNSGDMVASMEDTENVRELVSSVETPVTSDSNKLTVDFPANYPITNNLTIEHSQSDECISSLADIPSAAYTAAETSSSTTGNRAPRIAYAYPKVKTKSYPNLSNEPITEENESEFEDSPRNSPHLQRRASQRRRQCHSCRLPSPIHSRRSSYSSSDDDDSHYLLEKSRHLPHSLPTSGTQISNSHSNKNNSSSDQLGNNTKTNTNNMNTDKTCLELNEKLLSLVIDDLEQNIMSSKVFHPGVNLKLNNMMNSAYGRHLSDTNLTTYSMQLQLALAKEKLKNLSSTSQHFQQHHHNQQQNQQQQQQHNQQQRSKKSSSDSNLVKRFGKKKHQLIIPSEFFKTKEMIFKYLKRGSSRGSSKSTSSLSLSAPIEEEEPTNIIQHSESTSHVVVADNGGDVSDTFSDIQDATGPVSEEILHIPLSKSDNMSSSKYLPQEIDSVNVDADNKEVTGNNIGSDTKINRASVRPGSALVPGQQVLVQVASSNGSVCCSLV